MNNYWAERSAKAAQKLTDKSIEETEKQLVKYYSKTMAKVIGQFEKTYNKVLASIAEDRMPTPADLYKLDTYWHMQGQLKKELEKLGEHELAFFSTQFEQHYKNVYRDMAWKGEAAYNTIDNDMVKHMINEIWCADGMSWNQRVWRNTDLLQQELNDKLIECVVTGKKTSELKKSLMQRFKVSYERADTLVRTELAHIQTQAAKQRYQEYGIKEVQILVDADERTCDTCAELEGKKYPINGKMPVPVHPNCRCCIVPVID